MTESESFNPPLAFAGFWGKLARLKSWFTPFRIRCGLAAMAGLLLAAAFPNLGIAGLGWVAPGLIWLCAAGLRPKETFRVGYTAGFAHYLASLGWLLHIPVAFAPILGWLALSAFLALYPATWVWLVWKMFPTRIAAEAETVAAPPAGSGNFKERFRSGLAQFTGAPWIERFVWTLAGAALWVALEMLVTRFLGGFPWNLLGDSQYRLIPLVQIASVTGIYGISFLMVWVSLSLVCAGAAILARPAQRNAWVGEIILPFLAVGTIYGLGCRDLLSLPAKGRELKVALIQPSFPQTTIWDGKENANRFRELIRLSEQALTNRPDVLIWPEAAVPEMLRWDEETALTVGRLAREHNVWIILNSEDATPLPQATTFKGADFYNSSFLVSPEGRLAGDYRKRKLVIFGEYVPWVRWLPFIKFLTPIEGSFTPGTNAVSFDMADLKTKASVLICYEDAFPQSAREAVFADTDFLINLTNDGWFGEGSAQWQQAAMSIFRAVENGLPLVRCSNNGLTCWIDDRGRIRQKFESTSQGIYGSGFMIANIPLRQPGQTRPGTFYGKHGDVFGWACVAWALLKIGAVVRKDKRGRKAE